MKQHRFLWTSIGIECLITLCVLLANMCGAIGFALFYNIGYGLLLSLVLPLIIAQRKKEDLSSFGIKPLARKQYLVCIGFVLFSVGGQLIPIMLKGIAIRFDLLPICLLPLIMTTFFEEFLFRGFIQTRIEKQYGWIIAVLFSGALFSLYHLGYPGFRTLDELLLLFAVGIGFSLAYKLSDNNLIVAYFVNLPNAFVTYILKSEQFPLLTNTAIVFAGITILMIIAIFTWAIKHTYGGYGYGKPNHS